MLLMILFITFFCYIASFIVSTRVMNYILYKIFDILRSVVFKIIGIKIEYRGLENIPNGAVIFASKHQSAFETSFFFNKFKRNTIYCFKAEIAKVPLWGRIATVNGGIAIDRGNSASFRKFISEVQETLNIDKSIAIFPEGTRVSLKSRPKFKKGIAKIYSNTTAPIVPVALNTGDCLPRGSKLIYPAHVIIEFLQPIANRDLSEDEFMEFLHKQINDKSDELSNLAKLR